MECNSAREQLDGRPNDAVGSMSIGRPPGRGDRSPPQSADRPAPPPTAVAAHLRECAACRAEAAFRTRLAAALTAMPRAAAPDALMARVMADLQKPALWVLRAWEVVGLAAACLLLVLVPMALGLVAWSPGAALAPQALAGWIGSIRMSLDGALRDGQTMLAHSLSAIVRSTGGMGSGAPLIAGVAVAAFALALALLLSWRGNGSAPGEESARA